ncbi:HAMP domain-containing histidine kinase [Hymenobacter sp. 5317J-9]|uniref:sensor histidine kinase n=1 Tax=Hymenobacter sp. 5317J-9 TaxID=2932250 RepID=UPI001FD6904B|nr:HAMP domain-containing sensor histidine kinase [Hymenobacter sp. 5317J-9]UOQ98339.1 HAMP domain-containing histidine kinase [Hymenobacter sp. 5317J-9]
MKLLTRTNRYYLGLSATLFVLGTGLLYEGLQHALAHEVDEQLQQQRTYLTARIQRTGALPTIALPQELTIDGPTRSESLRDTVIFDPVEREPVPFRVISFPVVVRSQVHWLTLRKSLLETEDVLKVVMGVMLAVMTLLFGSLLLLNRWLSRWLWAPFRRTLQALRGFQLQQPESLALPVTPIDEFSELNQAVAQLTQRVAADYRALKEFTENAAHETQTPLAIMQARLEQLVQDSDLPERTLEAVQDVYRGARRLSRLHQALTLLSKIENRQFNASVPVSLDSVVQEKLRQLQDFLEDKDLEPQVGPLTPVSVVMHPALAESLVGNLLQNAVKHNVRGGLLRVQLNLAALEITNTGPELRTDPMLLLGRFRKHNAASDSPGLGLSIAEQICTYYGFRLSYAYAPAGHLHTLRVTF